MEYPRLVEIDGVARLGVQLRQQPGLHLIGRRRLDAVNDPAVAGPHAIGRKLRGVWRPGDRLRVVGIAFRAVVAERLHCAARWPAGRRGCSC